MWSVRMRASRFENGKEIHVSGAEGIFEQNQIGRVLRRLLIRAFDHKRGKAQRIVFTVEEIVEPIHEVKVLRVSTLEFNSPKEAKEAVKRKLESIGVSKRAIFAAFEVLESCSLRGASLIDYLTGERLERDRERGIRVSRLQMEQGLRKRLLRQFRRLSAEPQRVIEALTLASKVASFDGVVAELCISDNPDYTTGYISSREFGYLRITNIKEHGDSRGGRVFFVKGSINLDEIYSYLERTPVIVK